MKSARIRVRSGLLRKDLSENTGNFDESISAEPTGTTNRSVVQRNLSDDAVMCSQETEPDCDMVSLTSNRTVSLTPIGRIRLPSEIMEIEESSQCSLEAWALACRSEADAAVTFAELEERRAQSSAALAAAALLKANKLAVAAEEARRKAAVACKQARKLKISAQEAADFALKSLEAASKAEEAAVEFRFLRFDVVLQP